MATPHERALGLLAGLAEPRPGMRRWREGPEGEGQASGTLDALISVGLLPLDEAEAWRRHLADETEVPVVVDEIQRGQASDVLEELLGEADPEGPDPDSRLTEFHAALEALAEVGTVDADDWDHRWRQRLGLPTAEEECKETVALNAGGTEQQLGAVVAGPVEPVDGVRVLFALRFADGISFTCWRDPETAPRNDLSDDGDSLVLDAELRDDVGTVYFGVGGGGSETDQHVSFRTAPPAGASWVELVLASGKAIRVSL